MEDHRWPQGQAVQSKADAGKRQDTHSGYVIKQHRGDQTSRSTACESSRASQHVIPSEINPAPPTRATVKALGASSGDPSSSATVVDEKQRSAKPAPSSITAVTVCSIFMENEMFWKWLTVLLNLLRLKKKIRFRG
ncbi:MAG: hypothetical protein JO170_30755 [Verrucomicrobia bacterium]|nr:hypothetical protein [Verrucomicrobiota bacterium]